VLRPVAVRAQGGFLDDVQRLDLDTMAWAPPPAVGGAAPGAPRRAAGHSLAGLLAFGGCTPTPHGVMPIARTDLLLLGARRPPGRPARALRWSAASPIRR